MNLYEVVPLVKQAVGKLTYSYEGKLKNGCFVNVPFGSKTAIGVVIIQVNSPQIKTKNIISTVEESALPDHLVQLGLWMSEYYKSSLSAVMQTITPNGIGKSRRLLDLSSQQGSNKQLAQQPLTQNQADAIKQISLTNKTSWLHGDTGSGKTRIYSELIDKRIAANKDCIVLVPEISLTPQLVKQLRELSAAENVFVIHSKISESKRHQLWQKISKTSPCLIIGTRSSLFAPVQNLGLIIIDEAHESSYHQDKSPKYNSLRVAGSLSRITNCKLVFGSATPPVEEIYQAKQIGLEIINLNKKIHTDNRHLHLVDLSEKIQFKKNRFLSDLLLASIEKSLSQGDQSMLLLNRRGTRQTIACQSCGWFAECKNCLIPLKYHHDEHLYRCHLCGLKNKAVSSCPKCGEPEIKMTGIGTKQLILDLNKLFPSAKVFRYDQDTLKTFGSHSEIFKQINQKKTDIIVGTQLIAKGFDLPRLRTVASINSDTGFHLPDFSSTQKTFQMIYQLAGRGGRRGQNSDIFIQTFMPKNYAIDAAKQQNYYNFYQQEITNRKKAALPPFVFLLKLECKLKSSAKAATKADKLKEALTKSVTEISVLGPTPSFHEFLNGYYHWQIVIKSKKRQKLLDIIDTLPSGWDFELDPITLL